MRYGAARAHCQRGDINTVVIVHIQAFISGWFQNLDGFPVELDAFAVFFPLNLGTYGFDILDVEENDLYNNDSYKNRAGDVEPKFVFFSMFCQG